MQRNILYFFRAGLFGLFLFLISIASAWGQCGIAIDKVTVSGCYSVSGTSKAMVSVQVSWASTTTNSFITVSTGTQSQSFRAGNDYYSFGPGTVVASQMIVSPQVITLEIDANGPSSTTVSARFDQGCTTPVVASYTVPPSCLPTACQTGGLGGVVFNDFNGNGFIDTNESFGVAGVAVRAYACDNTLYQATSDDLGRWQISGPVVYPVRVEFSGIPAAFLNTSTVYGANSKTTVQFVDAANCSVNLGINDPADYCQSNPLIITPCYVSGNPLITGTAATDPALVGFPYTNNERDPKTFMLPASAVGTTWGMVYNRYTKHLFSAAVLKRHAGLGPGGLDAIYVTDLTNPSSPQSLSYVNVNNLGAGNIVGTFISNTARGLSPNSSQPSYDPVSFSAVGKTGIGGLSGSPDGEKMYFISMANNALYSLDLAAYKQTGNISSIALTSGINGVSVPDMGCVNGRQRSWAVKYYRGKVYVGAICDGSSGTKSSMKAAIFVFDPVTRTFAPQPVLEFPLTYPKGYVYSFEREYNGWYTWTDSWEELYGDQKVRPMPILSDIEFDDDGSMILAITDRCGFMTGYENFAPTETNRTPIYVGQAGGDILRAFYTNGTYILENAGKAGSRTGWAPGNNSGPGFGEFYRDDSSNGGGNNYFHTETGFGSILLRHGSGEVVMTQMDPFGIGTPYEFVGIAGGIRHLSNTTGLVNDAYVIYEQRNQGGAFGKSVGLGDLELACDPVQYLQIGNRVWLDDDRDGIQDACEKGLANIRVDLYRGTTLVSSTTTNTVGEYYFSYTAVQPNTAYQLVFGTDNQFNGSSLTLNGGTYVLTTANSTSPTANALNNSDAQIGTVAGITAPVISFTTGNMGQVNHTFDVGFVCQTPSYSLSITPASCVGQTISSDGIIRLSNITGSDKVALYAASQSTPPSYTAATNMAVVSGAAAFTVLTNPTAATGTVYNLILFNGPSCSTIISVTLPQATCCALTVTASPGPCAPATNQYSSTAEVRITNTGSGGVLTITDGAVSQTLAVAARITNFTATAIFNGLASGTGIHTVVAGLPGCSTATTTYSAPASCTVCSLTVTAIPGPCISTTNQYSSTAVVQLTNSGAGGVLTITDGAVSQTLAVAAGITNFTTTAIFNGLASGTGIHTVVAGLPGCSTATTTYSAPTSCTIQAVITTSSATVCYGQSATLIASGCNGTISWSNGTTGGTLITPILTQTTNYTATCTTISNSVATAVGTVTVLPQPLLSLQASSTLVTAGTPVSLSALGCAGSVSWSTGANGTTISVTPTNASQTYSATCVTGPGCQTTATININTLPPASPSLKLTKVVSKSLVKLGEVVSYTVSLANIGTVVATDIVVSDTYTVGITVVPNSVQTSVGTFSATTNGGQWLITTLPAGATATLTFSASILSEGVSYNTAIIPDQQVQVCTSVPVQVCQGDSFSITLGAPEGYSRYQWYRTPPNSTTSILVADGSQPSFTAVLPGAYQVIVDGGLTNVCSEQGCCPVIIEEVGVPSYTAVVQNPTCATGITQANSRITLANIDTTTGSYLYQVAAGSSFSTDQVITGNAAGIPANGTVATGLAPGAYTVRVWLLTNGQASCPRDLTVYLIEDCVCPPGNCVPFVIRKIRFPR